MGQNRVTNSDWKTTPNVIIKSFNQDDGLPVVSLTDLAMGVDNHLYIASYAGLSRFDGTHFELISSEQYPELISNRIISLLPGNDGSVWIWDEKVNLSRWKSGKLHWLGSLATSVNNSFWDFQLTRSGEAWFINNQTVKILHTDSGFTEILPPLKDSVISYTPVSETTAWMLTRAGLVEYADGKTKLHIPASQLPGDNMVTVSNLKTLKNDRLVIFNHAWILIYDISAKSHKVYTFDESIKEGLIRIFEVDENRLLIHLGGSYYILDNQVPVIKKAPEAIGVTAGFAVYNPNRNGKILYIGSNKIIYDNHVLYEPENGEEIHQGLQDKEGNIWVSSAGQGLRRISVSPFRVLNSSKGLGGDNAYSIVEDRNKSIWFGTQDAGITRITNNRTSFWNSNTFPEPAPNIRSLYVDKKGGLLAGSWFGGIRHFNGTSWSTPDFTGYTINSATVEAFYEDEAGNLWMGTREGIVKKNSNSNHLSLIKDEAGSGIPLVQVITNDHYNHIWFGTNGMGLYTKQHDSTSIHPVSFDNSYPSYSIRDIFTGRPDTLWMATENQGLIRALIDVNGDILSYTALTKDDGLPDIGVHRILADRYGFFWLPSNRGISRVNEHELNAYLDNKISQLWIQTFTEDDGLPIRETNGGTQSSGLVASDGTIWIPTQKGAVWFDPASFLKKNPFEFTEIQINKIEALAHEYLLYNDSSLTVKKNERSLNITLSLLHFSSPENLHIEYHIPSLKTGWQKLSRDRQFNIANIPPGTYTIEMRLAGVPEALHAGNSFFLIVPSYFYEESWFFVLFGIIALGLVGLVFANTIRSAKKRESILNERVNERTHLLREKTTLLEEQKTQTEQALTTVQDQAQKLERLNKVKTDFFINITHELRTPLTLIKGPLGLLKQASDKKTKDSELQLGLIERNSNRLNNLVDRLLSLLRMETEPVMEKIQKINLGDFVRHLAAQFESSEGLADKTFETRLPADAVFIYADPYFLESILNNLITNAIKYTNQGDRITIHMDHSVHEVFLIISDTGIGISAEDLQHIFDPFYRSENAKNIEGSGIGLSIVKRYMERIGGNVQIESETGRSTAIRLGFPIPDEQSLEKGMFREFIPDRVREHTTAPSGTFTQSSSNSKNATLLIVDDNKDLRMFYTLLLEEHYAVLTAASGQNALELMKNRQPDLIISDVMMPGMDGLELVQTIRARKKFKLIPIIMLSAKKTDKSITEGLKAGAHVYLTKPVDNQILLAQIDALLTREERLKKLPERFLEKLNPADQELVNKVDELILRHLSDPSLSVNSIAEALYISYPTLYRKWKKITGGTLNEYIVQTRLKESIQMIEEKGCSFTEASGVCGFNDPAYFSKAFKKYYHTTPTEYFKH